MQWPGGVRRVDAGHLRAVSLRSERHRVLWELHHLRTMRIAGSVRLELLRPQGQRRSVYGRGGLRIRPLRRRNLLRRCVRGTV
jgi:hypothetical protein